MVASFAAGFIVACVVWICLPVHEWGVTQVIRAYITLNWTHTREVWYLQGFLNYIQLPFTLADTHERAVVQQVMTGLIGATLPMLACRFQGRSNRSFPFSLGHMKRAKRGPKPIDDVPLIELH